MKYISKNKGHIAHLSGDMLLKNLLETRGIEDVEAFLNPSPEHLYSPFLFKNMEAGCELLAKHLERRSRIYLLIDADVDGYTSASIIYQFIKNISGIECVYLTHEEKKHGLYSDILERVQGCDLIICPDSSTNDEKACQVLKERGIDVLILDHHVIEVENNYAVVINSADGQYPNPSLVGAMVVFKFCQAYKFRYQVDVDLTTYLPLAALGQIADMGGLSDADSRYLVLKGLTLFSNHPFLSALCEALSYSMNGKVTIETVSWNLSPLLNATIRMGEYRDKIHLFEALSGIERVVPYKARKSKNNPAPVEQLLPLHEYMVIKCKNLKSKQDNLTKKNVALIEEQIERYSLDSHSVIVLDGGEMQQAFTGLVANKISQKYKRPCLILKQRSDGLTLGGSARNYSKHPLDDFRQFILDSGLANYASGHKSALGCEIPASNLPAFVEYADRELADVVIEDVWHVDYAMSVSNVSERDVLTVATYDDIWGGNVEKPKFCITDIYLMAEDIKLVGEKKNIIRFETTHGNQRLTFIKFFASEKLYHELIHRTTTGFGVPYNGKLKLTVIGEFKINEYNNNTYPQIQIVDIQSEKVANQVLF